MIKPRQRETGARMEMNIGEGELILDETEMVLYVGDGITPGGLKVIHVPKVLEKIKADKIVVVLLGDEYHIRVDNFKDLIWMNSTRQCWLKLDKGKLMLGW